MFAELNDPNSEIVGLVHGTVTWDSYLLGLLPDGVSGVYCVLQDTCGGSYTYELNGAKVSYIAV